MNQEDVSLIEQYFKLLESSGDMDSNAYHLVYDLVDKIRRQREEIEKLTALNRHYFFHFYNGDFDQFEKDFNYLL